MKKLWPLILDTSTNPAREIVEPKRRTLGGQPVKRFEKEIIRCGNFVKEADDISFTITPLVLSHWVKTFKRFVAAGNKVFAPVGHTNDPEKNKGWVVDLVQRGNSLFGIFDLVGEDAIALAGRTDVSIYSPASFMDAHGNEYVRPITHIALCSEPVIPGLSGWVPLAASKGGKFKLRILRLSNDDQPRDHGKFASTGDVEAEAFSGTQLADKRNRDKWLHPKPLAMEASNMPAALLDPNNPDAMLNPKGGMSEGDEGEGKELKLADTIDAAVEEQILGIFRGEGDVKSKLAQLGDLVKRHDKIRSLLNLDGGAAAGEEGLPPEVTQGGDPPMEMASEDEDKEKDKAIAASRSKVGPVVLRLAAENFSLRIGELVRLRKITPAVATELKSRFMGKANGSLSLSLSRAPASGRIELDHVIAALEKNSAMPVIGERSGAQLRTLQLSNPANAKAGQDDETKDAVEFMWGQAGVQNAK